MVGLDFKVKKFFFDTPKVMARVAEARRKSLSRAGAFVRTRARSMLRRRKKSSAPGTPPSVHSSNPNVTLKKILFAYEPSSDSVVIGPVKLNQSDLVDGIRGSGTAPNIQEFGGTRGVFEVQGGDGEWRRADMRSKRRIAGKPTRLRTATYPPRPFMGPSLRQEVGAGRIANVWANSVKGN